jgi:hypothetical protein
MNDIDAEYPNCVLVMLCIVVYRCVSLCIVVYVVLYLVFSSVNKY